MGLPLNALKLARGRQMRKLIFPLPFFLVVHLRCHCPSFGLGDMPDNDVLKAMMVGAMQHSRNVCFETNLDDDSWGNDR